MNLTDTERGWVAATLVDHGSFTKNTIHRATARGPKTYVYPRLEVHSREEWLVDRLQLVTQVGRKTTRLEVREEGFYPLYRWTVSKQDELRDLAIEILPLLPKERREKVLEVL